MAGEAFSGLSAADFLSDADTRVAYSNTITKATTRRSKIKPFIATNEQDNTSIVMVRLKTCELGSIVGIEMEDVLIGSGATGNVDFNASSEDLKKIKQFVKIDRYQHKVPSKESIVNQRVSNNFKTRAKTALSDWSTMKFDKIFFSIMSANCTNIVACGHHTATDTTGILKADVLTTADVEEAKRRAELGVDAAGNEVPPLLPVRILKNETLGFYDDIEIFVMFVGTDSARNIKSDPNWEAARKDALERSKMHPIFTGALGLWDGVLMLNTKTDTARQSGVKKSTSRFDGFGNVKTFDLATYAGAASQETEINLLMGAMSCTMVVDHGIAYYDWADKDDPRIMNAGIDRVFGMAKTKYEASLNDGILEDSMFDGNDFGVVAVIASTGK